PIREEIEGQDGDVVLDAEGARVLCEGLPHLGVLLHEHRAGRASGEGLEGERAGAREEVEHAGLAEGASGLERRGEGLADAIGRRPDPGRGFGRQNTATQTTADDPHRPWVSMSEVGWLA